MFSKRLGVIASKIPPYDTFADIGCDHGYLMIEAIVKYDAKYAYGVDNKLGPITSAKNNLIKYDVDSSKYQLTQANGISTLPDNIHCVVIAGMGTDTIKTILNNSLDKLPNINRFVFDSHRNINELRKFVSELSYEITNEEIILEDGKYYEIITFDKAESLVDYTLEELEFGPILLKEKNEVFISKWNNELNKLKKIYENTNSFNILNRIKMIERIL